MRNLLYESQKSLLPLSPWALNCQSPFQHSVLTLLGAELLYRTSQKNKTHTQVAASGQQLSGLGAG